MTSCVAFLVPDGSGAWEVNDVSGQGEIRAEYDDGACMGLHTDWRE